MVPRYNNFTLEAVDLHTYFDIQYAPMEGTYQVETPASHTSPKVNQSSANSNFKLVKLHNNITSDPAFVSTEFNYKLRNVTEEEAAKHFLTAFWDSITVTGDNGTMVTRYAFPWNLFQTPEQSKVLAATNTPKYFDFV